MNAWGKELVHWKIRLTPRVRSKAKRLNRRADNKTIKKQLTFHNSVLEDLKANYGALRSDRQRHTMAKKISQRFSGEISLCLVAEIHHWGISQKVLCNIEAVQRLCVRAQTTK